MFKRVMKRFSSLMLAALLILSIVPAISLPALAATGGTVTGLSDTNIGLSFGSTSGNAAEDPWSASGTTISGSVVSVIGTCSDTHYNSTLTITNNKTMAATLSFDYTVALNSGTIKVDGTKVTAASSFSKELAAGASINVYMLSGSATATTITLTNVKLVSDITATTTFLPAENGSYTVDGAAITEETSITRSSTQGYALAATPADGYLFKGWYDVTNAKYISTEASTTLNMEYNATITAKFAPVGVAMFEVGGQVYEDLNDATAYATANSITKVTLISDGTLSGSYTIPDGVILLIPFDSAKTLYTDTPVALYGGGGNRIAYRTLTLAEGASLTVNGGISVGGRYNSAAGSASGFMTGAYGLISMESGSQITVKSGGALYAWGFVTGSGNVTVESGGAVYEWYQIADFRGGTATLHMGNKVFPFSQYFVQNVEAPMTINAGATETVYTGVYASSKINNASITFIGENGMFKLTSGSVTKTYDGATDRLRFTINGEMELKQLSLNLAGMNVSSANYVLPITNNISLEIASGKLTVNQTTALLAGVDVTVASGAELLVSGGYSVYLYDRDEWIAENYVTGGKFKSVVFAPGKTYNRTEADLVDARIDVLGTMIAAGAVYTTAGGANICSDGAGIYRQTGAPGTETVTYQYTQSGSDVTAHQIPITPAKLHNADGSYTETADAAANDYYEYSDGFWLKNGEAPLTYYHISFVNYDGAILWEGDVAEGETPVYEGATPEKPATAEYSYTFTGWTPDVVAVTGDATYTAVFSENANSYTITYNVNGVFYAEQTYDYGAAVTAPEYTVPEGHTFSGWNVPETMPAENLVLNATLTVNSYTITYNVNGVFYATQTYDYGAAVTAPEYTVPEGHTFSGWNVPETMPAENLVLNATLTVNSYTITYNVNGVFYATQTYEYGAAVTAPEYTVPEGHTFSGWNVPEIMPAENLVLNAALTVNSYTITYNVNGEFYAAQTYEYGAAVTAPEYTVPEGHTFSGWNVPETMPAESLVLNATLTVNSYTITYNVNGVFYAEQTYEYGAAVTAPEYTCEYTYYHFSGWAVPETMPAHDASYDAVMTPYDGIEWYADELYLFDNGEMVEFPGLVRVVTDDDVKYYYFGEENFAARARMIDGEFVTEYMVERNNGLLFAGDNYIFGEDGVIEHLDYTLNGIKEVDGKLYYLIDGVIIRHGLVEVDGSFYYCRSTSGELVRNTRYWITRTNGLTWADGTPIEAGYYFFDEEAKLSDKNGIIAENGSLYYYVHGSLTPAGLIELDGDYYYVRTSNCEVIHGRSYWITVTNGLMPIGLYEFGEDGRMLNPPEVQPGEEEPEIKNGIVAEFGSLYYYVDGVLTPAGLIELDGEYYYVRTSNCEVVHGCSYWITVTNGLMPAGMYTFADDGKLIH